MSFSRSFGIGLARKVRHFAQRYGSGTRGKKIRTPILLYHAVDPQQDESPIPASHNISPQRLYQQLSFLRQHFDVVALDDIFQRIRQGKAIEGLAAITFDDGYASALEYAVPILDDLNLPATMFLITCTLQSVMRWRDKVLLIITSNLVEQFLDFARQLDSAFDPIQPGRFYQETKNPTIVASPLVDRVADEFFRVRGQFIQAPLARYSTIEQLTRVKYPNLSFGNHSHHHYVLSTMSKVEQAHDINKAERLLGELDVPLTQIFSIPFGGLRTFNQDTLDILEDLHYTGYLLSSGYKPVDACAGMDDIVYNNNLIALNRFMPADAPLFS